MTPAKETLEETSNRLAVASFRAGYLCAEMGMTIEEGLEALSNALTTKKEMSHETK